MEVIPAMLYVVGIIAYVLWGTDEVREIEREKRERRRARVRGIRFCN